MRNITIAALSIFMMLFAVPSYSHTRGDVDISIVSDNGGELTTIPFKEFTKRGTKVTKKYIEAVKGENYSIIVKNKTAGRIGVVIAVDGRNIISGNKSSLKRKERMYIIGPYGHARLEGWRTNLDTVHRFYFTDQGDSYAVKTFNDSSAMGVIAVSVFREKHQPKLLERFGFSGDKMKSAPSEPSPGKGSAAYEEDRAGTGFGDKTNSHAVEVEFQAEQTPFATILAKYEWRDVLCRKGLLKCSTEQNNRLWDGDGFSPYPPGYIDR